ncbi:hypothetical protein CVIRNUC_002367 [Coccomyxa viridis]|uniref:AP2/ERF domain-containing protein n=1 Tax=Coccomyxa viridis TaxID=1274662 RepID=A0AAV1HZ81_9CHLO|nr:hypothetical protein CVIRNUC_002367 [Coccomyxa viridis]
MSRRKAEAEKASDDSYALGDEDDSNGMKTYRKAKRPRKAGDKKVARSTSRFRGVTHHCRTGRFEAHIWQEGKQIYLGGFDAEEQAALAYDLAALKFRGLDAQTNYDKSTYEQEMLQFNEVTKEEVVQTLRRQSKGFQKTSSQFRGVTRHQKGKFEARCGAPADLFQALLGAKCQSAA